MTIDDVDSDRRIGKNEKQRKVGGDGVDDEYILCHISIFIANKIVIMKGLIFIDCWVLKDHRALVIDRRRDHESRRLPLSPDSCPMVVTQHHHQG